MIMHRSISRVPSLLAAMLVSAALTVPCVARAQVSDADRATARTLAVEGQQALDKQDYAAAAERFARADALVHAPTLMLGLARAQVGLGKLVSAQETYLKLMREELAPNAPAAFKNAQAAAKDELAAIEPKIASLRIELDGVGQRKITVKMDDQIVPPALVGVFRPVDPGKHEIAVYPLGGSPAKGTVELKDGEKKDFHLNVPEGPPPSGLPVNAADNPDAAKPVTDAAPTRDKAESKFMTPMRGAGIGVAVVGLSGVVVGSIFLAKGASTQGKADDIAVNTYHCSNGGTSCPPGSEAGIAKDVTPLDNTAARQKTIGSIGLAVGGVALAGGVALIVLGKPKPAPAAAPAKASIEPWFTGNALGLRGTF